MTTAQSTRDEILAALAERHGTPSFVYFMDEVKERVARVRQAFGGLLQVSYAMKCNPHPALLTRMRGWVDALDVSSRGELERGLRAGFESSRISFTGPAKQDVCLELAVKQRIGEVVLESAAEARRLSRIAQRHNVVQGVLVRIAPKRVPKGFGVNMAGRPCQFGIDEEDLDEALAEIRSLPGLSIRGFHIYSGTQCLKADAIVENYAIFLELFRRVSTSHGISPRKLVFGSGLGIPYHDGDLPLDLERVSEATVPKLRALKAEPNFAETELVLETGRYLVAEAGVYLTRVVSRKRSRGTEIAICDGGMHHHLGACGHLGMVIPRPYRMHKVSAARPADESERTFDLYGPLCTTIDVLGRGVKLGEIAVDDVIAVGTSGAYGVSASPGGFISHPPPNELLIENDAHGVPTVVDAQSREQESA